MKLIISIASTTIYYYKQLELPLYCHIEIKDNLFKMQKKV